jgi:predicted kinase
MSSPLKVLIQMSGAPGSGKSTLAKSLAPLINGVVIDYDLLKTFFLDNEIPFKDSGRLSYSFIWVLAEEMIKQGRNVIVDSPCHYAEILKRGTALAKKSDYEYKYIECRVKPDDVDLLDQRIRSRTPMRSQRSGVYQPPRDVEDPQQSHDYFRAHFKERITDPVRPESNSIIVVDSYATPQECLSSVLEQLNLPTSTAENQNIQV